MKGKSEDCPWEGFQNCAFFRSENLRRASCSTLFQSEKYLGASREAYFRFEKVPSKRCCALFRFEKLCRSSLRTSFRSEKVPSRSRHESFLSENVPSRRSGILFRSEKVSSRKSEGHFRSKKEHRFCADRDLQNRVTGARATPQAAGDPAALGCRCRNQSNCPVTVTTPCASTISTITEVMTRPRDSNSFNTESVLSCANSAEARK
jgi:hypothetical protein